MSALRFPLALAVLLGCSTGAASPDAQGSTAERGLALTSDTVDAGTPTDAAAPTMAEAAQDAGAPEPSMAGESGADAGEAEPLPASDPAAPLPVDIVARSALPLHGLVAGKRVSDEALWDYFAGTPALCLGEQHDLPQHHYAELQALQALTTRSDAAGEEQAVGFEMFQRPFQGALTAYVENELDEAGLLSETEYATRWGYDFSLYRPLLESARELGLPALALNARTELTRQIARGGLASLDASEQAELPELNLDDPEHQAFIYGLFGVLPEHASEFGLEDIYTAQTVWDETMADTAARWLGDTGPNARLLIFAGIVHCQESAIPRRITRRTGQPVLSVGIAFASELGPDDVVPTGYEGYDAWLVLDD